MHHRYDPYIPLSVIEQEDKRLQKLNEDYHELIEHIAYLKKEVESAEVELRRILTELSR